MKAGQAGRVVALTGGVGGAKLGLGLAQVVAACDLTLVVNTGDDFTHLGLAISPDVDTTLYTLAGLSDETRGWGLSGESWNFMAALRRLGGEDWFALGDLDLATHVERTRRLAGGETLSAVTAAFATRLGVGPTVAPVSDDPVRTLLDTDEGRLSFQDYFVRRRTEPAVRSLSFEGAAEARLSPAVARALSDPDLQMVLICPSNPWLSVLPMLETGDMRARLKALSCPLVAVTPIIGGRAVKGPTAKLMAELGLAPDATSVAAVYRDLADGFLLDEADAALAPEVERMGLAVACAPTLMTDLDAKVALAQATLAFGRRLRRRSGAH